MRNIPINKVNDYVWEIPPGAKPCQKVPVRIYADSALLEKMKADMTIEQGINVGCLPGIYKYSIILPDGHQGYGFPIGGVAAIDAEEGVISPGGIGYDINCGVRVLRTNLTEEEVRPKLKELVDAIFRLVPPGVGGTGHLRLSPGEFERALAEGVEWAVQKGYGWAEDMEYIEERGSWKLADPSKVSEKAKARGRDQLGTLGSGNHFLEIQVVDKIFDEKAAKTFGIEREGQVVVMIHTGSRGFGHQVATDYLLIMERNMRRWGLNLPDRELAAAPLKDKVAEDYIKAMASAANFAWTNRHIIMHWVREAFKKVFGSIEKVGLELVYDVAHNIAKLEEHVVDDKGTVRKVWVHRKGATRAFPPGRPEIPAKYREIGQPVLIPGSMGTASWILVGTPEAMKLTFGTAPHGAGRVLSREAAIRMYPPHKVQEEMAKRGIIVRSAETEVISEEAPWAYKDVDRVVETAHQVGFARKVVRQRPIGVVKG
jgi:tRNA-splicing ligase RtcB